MTEPLVRKSFAEQQLREVTNSHAEVVNRLEKQLTEAIREIAVLKVDRTHMLATIDELRKRLDSDQ